MLPFPEIDPVIFKLGAFQIRWYALAYVLSFVTGYIFVRRSQRQRGLELSRDQYENLIFYIMLGVIIGGRLGYVIFYDPIHFLHHPLQIVLPFDTTDGFHFTGIMGMSFHGGALAVIIMGLIFARRNRISFYRLADPVLPWAAIGLFLGRMGNFINGELYGRVTAAWQGMIFPDAGVPLHSEAAQQVIAKLGWTVDEAAKTVSTSNGELLDGVVYRGWGGDAYTMLVNLPRHPSQLYEAFAEGALMAAIMFLMLRFVRRDGVAFWSFVGLYGVFRFLIEFVRQPDAHLGFVLGPFSMGQVLCSFMIAAGVIGVVFRLRAREAVSDA